MLKIVHTRKEHFEQIRVGRRHEGDIVNMSPDSHSGFMAVTLFRQEQIIAIIGGMVVMPGVLSAWALISDSVNQCPKEFHKTVKWMIDFYMKDMKLHRIQFVVRDKFYTGKSWARHLGFYPEGVLKAFYPGKTDVCLYAKVI